MNATHHDWLNWALCLYLAIRARQWQAVRNLLRHPRFMCAVIWCYTHDLGTWCEWQCGLPGLSAQVQREQQKQLT